MTSRNAGWSGYWYTSHWKASPRERRTGNPVNESSLHIFDVYQHPHVGLCAVRRGFSWEAFLLPSLWAVRRGLGMTTLLLFVLSTVPFDLARYAAQLGTGAPVQLLVALLGLSLIGLLPGTEGYRWHGRQLIRAGFVHRQTVAAANRRQAMEATQTQAFRRDPILVAAPGQRLGFTP